MKKQEKESFLDRVLLHSKNADERLFDMVLRFITFVILIIIIWIYADIAHARADSAYLCDYLLGDNPYNLKPYLNDSDWDLIDDIYEDVPTYDGTLNFTNEIPGNLVMTSEMDPENNYFIIGRNYWSSANDSGCIIQIPKADVINNHVMIIGENQIYSDSTVHCYNIWYDKRDSTNTGKYHMTPHDIPSGITNINTDIDYGQSVYIYFTNLPMLKSHTNVNVQSYIANGNTQDTFNVNYMSYDNILINQKEAKETDENHMYLKDFNIGMTGGNDILNSNIVISASWDDWVSAHIQDYSAHITYTMRYVGEPHNREDNNPDDPLIGTWTETIPLSKLASYHSIEFKTVTNHMNINNESLKSYVEALYAAGVVLNAEPVTIQDVLNGTSAEFGVGIDDVTGGVKANLGVLYNYLGYQYNHPTQEVGEELMYIKQFDFEVELYISSTNSELDSLTGSKFWDFLNGTSVNDYDILNNPNPYKNSEYNGKSESKGSSINNSNVAYGGNSSATANGGNVGNITITTGNGYKDTELHQLTSQDIVQNHQKIITVIEDLKYCFHQFAQENNHNSFIQMIYDDYNYIPGIEYITSSIIIICGVCILIFIIKIAF